MHYITKYVRSTDLRSSSGYFRYLADVRQFCVTTEVHNERPYLGSSTVAFIVCDRLANIPPNHSCHVMWLTWKVNGFYVMLFCVKVTWYSSAVISSGRTYFSRRG